VDWSGLRYIEVLTFAEKTVKYAVSALCLFKLNPRFVQVEIDEEWRFRNFAESISRPLLKEPYAVKKEIFFGREKKEKEN